MAADRFFAIFRRKKQQSKWRIRRRFSCGRSLSAPHTARRDAEYETRAPRARPPAPLSAALAPPTTSHVASAGPCASLSLGCAPRTAPSEVSYREPGPRGGAGGLSCACTLLLCFRCTPPPLRRDRREYQPYQGIGGLVPRLRDRHVRAFDHSMRFDADRRIVLGEQVGGSRAEYKMPYARTGPAQIPTSSASLS